jgi:uncharacterized membrane protein YdfJ with MMPL/SSD domain
VREGLTRRKANVVAMTTAGHSVIVAGISVVIALMGLFIMRPGRDGDPAACGGRPPRQATLHRIGLASSILIDGVLSRMVLLPGVIRLLGERAWWRRSGKEDPRGHAGELASSESRS